MEKGKNRGLNTERKERGHLGRFGKKVAKYQTVKCILLLWDRLRQNDSQLSILHFQNETPSGL